MNTNIIKVNWQDKEIYLVKTAHVSKVSIEDVDDANLLAKLMLAVKEVAKIKGAKNGFRTVINTKKEAGQEVFHLHIHVLAGRPLLWPPG